MEYNKFEIGDIVHLNSKPKVKMTIYNIDKGMVAVKYFNKNNEIKTAILYPEILTLSK